MNTIIGTDEGRIVVFARSRTPFLYWVHADPEVIGWIIDGTLVLEDDSYYWKFGIPEDEWYFVLVKLLRLAGYEVNP